MKNYLETKPLYPPTRATSHGWVDVKTGELLVAIKDLDKKLGITTTILRPAKPEGPQEKRGPGRPRGSLAKPK